MTSVGMMASGYTPTAAWSPPSIAGLQGWWDPSNTATITHASGAVSQIDDLSGNNRHFTQSNATYKPVTGTGTINGLNALNFATARVMTLTTTAIPQPNTLAAVCTHDGSTTLHRLLGASTFIGAAGGTTGRFTYGSSTSVSSTPEVAAGPHLVVGIFSATPSLRGDRTQIVTGTPGTVGFTTTIYLGANTATGGSGWRTLIGEMVIYNSAVTGTDLTNLETYLRTKWGTP